MKPRKFTLIVSGETNAGLIGVKHISPSIQQKDGIGCGFKKLQIAFFVFQHPLAIATRPRYERTKNNAVRITKRETTPPNRIHVWFSATNGDSEEPREIEGVRREKGKKN